MVVISGHLTLLFFLFFPFCHISAPQQEVENFKKLNVISKDEFDTLTPKAPVDPNQEVPSLPMPGGVCRVVVKQVSYERASCVLPSAV